jgi:hypothetical protein
MFWQGADDSLTGYQAPSIRMDSTRVRHAPVMSIHVACVALRPLSNKCNEVEYKQTRQARIKFNGSIHSRPEKEKYVQSFTTHSLK